MICMVYFSIVILTVYKVIYKRLSIKLSKLNIQLIQLSISKSSLLNTFDVCVSLYLNPCHTTYLKHDTCHLYQ